MKNSSGVLISPTIIGYILKKKSEEQLTAKGFSFWLIPNAQIRGRFNTEGKKKLEFNNKMEFETELWTNDEYEIANIYKLLLIEMEEHVKDCMLTWTKNTGHNIQMNQWEKMWVKG